MNTSVVNRLLTCFIFFLSATIFIQDSCALPRLDFPPPNIFIYAIPAPDFDEESGLVKGEVVLINTGGNHVGAFPILVWIEGLELQTKVSGWVNDMSGYGYTRSFSYQFNCNSGIFIPGRAYWVMAEIDNGIPLRSSGFFQYLTPAYVKPNLTFDFSNQTSNRYTFDPVTNEISFFNGIINKGTQETGSFNVSWYFSEDEIINTNDIAIGSHTVSEGLPASSQPHPLSNIIFDLDNLSGLESGNYYVGIIIDSGNDVTEGWEDDNTTYFSGVFPWGGSTGSMNLTSSALESEHSWNYDISTHELYLKNTIENTGSSQSGEFRIRRYLYSPSVGYILFDSEVVEGILPSGKQTLSNTIDLDELSGLPNGQYSVVMYIDDQEAVYETDETDNFGSFIEGAAPMFEYNSSSKANLGFYENSDQGIYNSMAYYPEDHFIYFRSGIGNYGQTAAPPFKVGYYLSEDIIINPNEDYFIFPWLFPTGLLEGSASGSDIIARDLDTYAPDLPPGTYYFGVYIDPEFAVDEFNESLDDNSGYFGDPSQIIEWTGPYCDGDFEPDGDLDGLDLESFISDYNSGIYQAEHIPIFAQTFGKNNCASLPAGGESAQQSSLPGTSFATSSTQMISGTSSSTLKQTDNLASVIAIDSVKTSKIKSETNTNWTLIEDYVPSTKTVEADPNEEECVPDEFVIEEVTWASSNGQEGIATGEWEWKIDEINLDLGINLIKLFVTDTVGNIAEKEIEVVFNKILMEDKTRLPKTWTRRLTYKFNFYDTKLEKPPTAANVTTWLWPEKIIITDDYLTPDNMDSDRITTEKDGFHLYHWSMECDISNKKIFYLDLPSNKL